MVAIPYNELTPYILNDDTPVNGAKEISGVFPLAYLYSYSWFGILILFVRDPLELQVFAV